MRLDFPDKELIAPELRLLMRSRHIYILFSGLIHILLGVYFASQTKIWRKVFQFLGSLLLFLGGALLIWAFVYETYQNRDFSEISRFGIYATFAGTISHLAGQIWTKQ